MTSFNRVLTALPAVVVVAAGLSLGLSQAEAGEVTTPLEATSAAQVMPAGGGSSATGHGAMPVKEYAMSLVGKAKFGPDFKHFDWVNPDAPKGGVVRQWQFGTFDSLNSFTVKGKSAVGLALIYDSLMVPSADEPSTEYGLIAKWVSYPMDFSSVTFGLRPEARFHDGTPITPEDVIFSLNAVKKAHPFYAFYYKNVIKVEKTGPHQVTFRFNIKGNHELPQIVSQLSILPRHFWTAKGADGKPRDLSKSSLEVPLGSGPYRIAKVDAGRKITYERVKDWWAKDLPVSKGQYNFDKISFTYYRDRNPAFETFKSGRLDFWAETSAEKWATGYDIPAVKKGWLVKKKIVLKTPKAMQAFVMNIRRKQFQDRRVRQAFNLAFDFEWANKNLFYGQYKRLVSYFQNTELQSGGLPKGRELELLETLRGSVPREVFSKVYANPVNSNSRQWRANMAKAQKLLGQAGWKTASVKVDDPDCGIICRTMTSIGLRSAKTATMLRDGKGKPFKIEFLLVSPAFKRVVLPFVQNLKLLGIEASVRVVDSAQYERRVTDFDYDVIVGSFAQSHSPGNEQRNFWGSAAADRHGSRNLIGIKSAAVDKLVDHIIFAKDRAELVAASHALDRVLLWNFYVVPQWYAPFERIAMWDKYAGPAKQPSQSVAFLRSWWLDKARAKKLAVARGK